MNIDLVVFDMAGTTINDDDGVNRCVRAALEAVGVSASREDVNLVMGIPKPVALARLIEAAGRDDLLPRLETIHSDFVERMVRFYESDPSVYAIPGAEETFRRLRAAGIRVGLDTGFSRDIASVVLARLGWTVPEVLDFSVTSDEVERGRPHPDMIHKAMQALGLVDPARIAKVGDTPSDLEEGAAAGCGLIIGVTDGTHTAEQLKPHRHTHLIKSVADLPALLGV